jgi:dihydrofolate reductase
VVALIAAYAKNRVMGNQGKIPWKIKGEQLRFRELTMGNVVVFGRRSYEEIGKPLPGRDTIVVSNTKKYEEQNCTTAHSLLEAVLLAGNRDVFIAGGASLYREAMEIVETMYLTEIDAVISGDVYFPEFCEEDFIRTVECHVEGELPYDYVTYSRRKKEG